MYGFKDNGFPAKHKLYEIFDNRQLSLDSLNLYIFSHLRPIELTSANLHRPGSNQYPSTPYSHISNRNGSRKCWEKAGIFQLRSRWKSFGTTLPLSQCEGPRFVIGSGRDFRLSLLVRFVDASPHLRFLPLSSFSSASCSARSLCLSASFCLSNPPPTHPLRSDRHTPHDWLSLAGAGPQLDRRGRPALSLRW